MSAVAEWGRIVAHQVSDGSRRISDSARLISGSAHFMQCGTSFSFVKGMQNILNSGFSEMPLDEFIEKVMGIIAALTGNANFPVTSPTVAIIQTALDAVTTAMAIQGPAREPAVAAARAALEQKLALLATNLETLANFDVVKLATTGFNQRKAPVISNLPPDVPGNLRLKPGTISGSVRVLFDPSDRAKSYQVQISFDPNAGPWTDVDTFSSSRGIVLTGLTRAKDIWVRVRAIGPNNTKSGWSDPATILVN
jgi:hypothetical protein